VDGFLVIHAESQFAIVDKACGLPSVPPRAAHDDPDAHPSVESTIPTLFPGAEGPLIVHRLDIETSGLMVVALTRTSHRALSRQFMHRKVGKSYVGILDALVDRDEGSVDLPIGMDWEARPRHRVDFRQGRPARTLYRVLDRRDGRTRVAFRPLTGRTHQIRIHASAPRCVGACLAPVDDYDCKIHRCGWPARGGLGAPILGDTLYHRPADRLHLHADTLGFFHPTMGTWLTFNAPAPF